MYSSGTLHTDGWTRVGWSVRTYSQQLCTDIGCSIEDQPGAMDDRDKWQESRHFHFEINVFIFLSELKWHTHTQTHIYTHIF